MLVGRYLLARHTGLALKTYSPCSRKNDAQVRETEKFVPICLKALCSCQWVEPAGVRSAGTSGQHFSPALHHDLFHSIASITQTLRHRGYRCANHPRDTTTAFELIMNIVFYDRPVSFFFSFTPSNDRPFFSLPRSLLRPRLIVDERTLISAVSKRSLLFVSLRG